MPREPKASQSPVLDLFAAVEPPACSDTDLGSTSVQPLLVPTPQEVAPVQLGMFGVGPEPDDGVHRVAAHTRQLASGDSVFVSEHLRWNRGNQPRQQRRSVDSRSYQPAADQIGLFDVQPAEQPTDSPQQILHVDADQIETAFFTAEQLPMFG